jgi:hypothetical protein
MDFTGLFDALYSRLILRDFFGKVVPGTIIIFSIYAINFSPADIITFVRDVSFYPALILIGFSWIIAFALQAIGETTRIVRYHTYKTNKEFYVRRHEFHTKTDPQEHQQLERLVVIKEACGNGYVALLLSGVLLTVHVLVSEGCNAVMTDFKLHWPVISFIVALIAFLAAMHFIHVRRQDEYMNAILEATGDTNKKCVANP